MRCLGCDEEYLAEWAPYCKQGPDVKSKIAGIFGRPSQRNPLRQEVCDSCSAIGYLNVQKIMNFLDTTDLRDEDLAIAFRQKLNEAKLFPGPGSIA